MTKFTSEVQAVRETPVGQWTYYGAFATDGLNDVKCDRVSVNIFQVIKTANGRGNGKKKGTGVYRVKDWRNELPRILGDAEAICQRLNQEQLDSSRPLDYTKARQIAIDVMRTRRALRQAGKA